MTTKNSTIYNAFTSGELSPRMDGRTDIKKYFKGAKQLENVFVYSHGGVTKRPGTRYIGEAGDSSNPVRVIPFEISTDQAYVLECGHQYIRFYTVGSQVATSGGFIYEIPSVYDGDDLFDIKFVQSADVMYLVHNDYPPYKLSRFGHTNWTLEEVDFFGGPFFDLNNTTITVEPNNFTGTVRLSASESLFDIEQVGGFWKIEDPFVEINTVVSGGHFSSPIEVDSGELVTITVDGTWADTITFQKSIDEGITYSEITNTDVNSGFEFISTLDGTLFRAGFHVADYSSGEATITSSKLDYYGYMKINSFISSTVVSGSIIKDFPSTSITENWAEGSWSEYRGYPSSIAFYEQRLLLAGSSARPQTIWGSQTADFENFENISNNDDEAYNFSIESQNVNTIQWMLDHSRVLLFGTHAGEWKFGDPDNATTPTFVSFNRQTPYGSDNIQAVPIDRFALFVQRGGKKIRTMGYDLRQDGYLSPEVSLLAEHLFQQGVKDMTYVGQPDTIVFMVDNVGDIIALTLDPQSEVAAFSKWTTNGYFESVTNIPSSAGADELWTVAKREIDGNEVRYIEQFQQNTMGPSADYTGNYYVDAGIEGSFYPGTLTASGADHLEGETVNVIVDGAPRPDTVITDGALSITPSGHHIMIGLNYISTLETMKLDIPTESGTAQGKPMSTFRVLIRLQDTVGLKVSDGAGTKDIIPFRSSAMAMNQKIPLFSGDKEIFLDTGFKNEQSIVITSDQPLPMTVLAIIADIQTSEY